MRVCLAAALLATALACGREPPAADVLVRAEFAATPSVRCIRITAVGATRTVSRDFGAAGGSSMVPLPLQGLPVGGVLILGTAFDLACNAVDEQHPTWTADAAHQTLQAGSGA